MLHTNRTMNLDAKFDQLIATSIAHDIRDLQEENAFETSDKLYNPRVTGRDYVLANPF